MLTGEALKPSVLKNPHRPNLYYVKYNTKCDTYPLLAATPAYVGSCLGQAFSRLVGYIAY
ncbi:hypothetical protein GCM10022228_04920 [Halomonas cibimaris]|uniref:Uncharacterized protein n=1 Tax=Halomonas cibimaris TaxID=657012 RepID=A0ABP7LE54_9GAMM